MLENWNYQQSKVKLRQSSSFLGFSKFKELFWIKTVKRLAPIIASPVLFWFLYRKVHFWHALTLQKILWPYCFKTIKILNGKIIPKTHRQWKLNWNILSQTFCFHHAGKWCLRCAEENGNYFSAFLDPLSE